MGRFRIKGLNYVSDENCFTRVYNNVTEVYRIKCKLK